MIDSRLFRPPQDSAGPLGDPRGRHAPQQLGHDLPHHTHGDPRRFFWSRRRSSCVNHNASNDSVT